MQTLLSTPRFRCYRTTDVIGVELGGALKNVLAIACGKRQVFSCASAGPVPGHPVCWCALTEPMLRANHLLVPVSRNLQVQAARRAGMAGLHMSCLRAGISDGLEMGCNARAALITRGMFGAATSCLAFFTFRQCNPHVCASEHFDGAPIPLFQLLYMPPMRCLQHAEHHLTCFLCSCRPQRGNQVGQRQGRQSTDHGWAGR